jgi:hypothetical protein
MLYRESDRKLMEEAWAMATAHREDLLNRSASAPALPAPALPAPVPPAVPRVIAMLQK